MMDFLAFLIITLLDIYVWLIIAGIIASWLVAFDVLNLRNKGVYKAYMMLNRVVDPPMAYVRKYVPSIGGLDLSPMVVIFGIYIIQAMLVNMFY